MEKRQACPVRNEEARDEIVGDAKQAIGEIPETRTTSYRMLLNVERGTANRGREHGKKCTVVVRIRIE